MPDIDDEITREIAAEDERLTRISNAHAYSMAEHLRHASNEQADDIMFAFNQAYHSYRSRLRERDGYAEEE